LSRDSYAICQFLLRPVELGSKNPEAVFHWWRRRTKYEDMIQETMKTP
jgi:hypothetical protein